MKLDLADLSDVHLHLSPTVLGSKTMLKGSTALKTPRCGISAGKGGLQEEDNIIMQESISPLPCKTCTGHTD